MRLTRFSALAGLTVACLLTNTAHGTPFSYEFSTLPTNGQITGSSGELVGWGYSLSNTDNTNWFEPTDLSASSWTIGTPDASYFDFPILKPDQTVVNNFDLANASGLYGLKISQSALAGQTDTGIFTLAGKWWAGNPLTGGTFIKNATLTSAPFSVSVASLQQMKGEIHSDLMAASFNAHRLAGQAVLGRLTDVRLGRSTSGFTTQNNDSQMDLVAHQAAQTLQAKPDKNIWIHGMGGFMTTDADKHASGFNETLYGVMLGSDFALTNQLQLGVAVGYVHNQVNANLFGNGTTDSIQFLGYGLWHKEHEFLNFSFGYGRDKYTAQRSVKLGGNTTYQSDVDGDSGSLDVEAGTRRLMGHYAVEPSFGVRGYIISRNAFSEKGLAGLSVKNTNLSAAQIRLGVKLSRIVEFGINKRITPELRTYWLHDEGDSIASQSQATLLGQSISISAANAGRDAAALGAGVTVEVGNNVALFADYNFEQRRARNGQNVFGGVRVSW